MDNFFLRRFWCVQHGVNFSSYYQHHDWYEVMENGDYQCEKHHQQKTTDYLPAERPQAPGQHANGEQHKEAHNANHPEPD